MTDEPTLGEVVRRLEAVHQDLKDDFRDLGSRLDSKVSMERYSIEQNAQDANHLRLAEQLREVEAGLAEDQRNRQQEKQHLAEQRRQDRRWVIAAILVPVSLALLQAYLAAKGAGT